MISDESREKTFDPNKLSCWFKVKSRKSKHQSLHSMLKMGFDEEYLIKANHVRTKSTRESKISDCRPFNYCCEYLIKLPSLVLSDFSTTFCVFICSAKSMWG
jgi:hypothetical protein